jgi:hypothetical protein
MSDIDSRVEKYGKKIVDENYTKKDCIRDWVTTHWAWEST